MFSSEPCRLPNDGTFLSASFLALALRVVLLERITVRAWC